MVRAAPRMRAKRTSTPASLRPQKALQKSASRRPGSGEFWRANWPREVVEPCLRAVVAIVVAFVIVVDGARGREKAVGSGETRRTAITCVDAAQHVPRPCPPLAKMNLTLYTVSAFVVLDSDGQRVLAKYYTPKLDGLGALSGAPPAGTKSFTNLKDQRTFEKGLFGKTKKPNC
jgi:hypothetical protein